MPAVYDGRIRIVGQDVVLADIAHLVAIGARHITFGDPDFLNGVRHSLRIVRAMHERFPDLTFDCTTKVEHILQHERVWAELAGAGCLFVVSALEGVNDEILERLDKGHTPEQASRAIALLRAHGIEIRPSFLPFTPWTTLDDVLDILDFVAEHDLIGNVDPVQYTIRLLLPEGSLLLDHPELEAHLGPYDPELLTYTWTAADPEDRRASGTPRRPGRAERRGRRADRDDVLEGQRRRLRGRRASGRAGAKAGARPVRLRRGEAAAHRAVVLLSGAHRGPVWPSRDRPRYWRRLSGCSGGISRRRPGRGRRDRARPSRRPPRLHLGFLLDRYASLRQPFPDGVEVAHLAEEAKHLGEEGLDPAFRPGGR